MEHSLRNMKAAASPRQRLMLAATLAAAIGLTAGWTISYRYPLSLHWTMHDRYYLRCEKGCFEWIAARYSKLVRFDSRQNDSHTVSTSPKLITVQVAIMENDARKLAPQYAIPSVPSKYWPFKQWPGLQHGHLYNLTYLPYVGQLRHSGHIFAPIVMSARNGIDAQVWATPCWLPLTCIITIGLLILWRIHTRIPQSLQAQGHCPTCGYDLRMTPQRCPECGTAPMNRNAKES
jgi:hypothetical protein